VGGGKKRDRETDKEREVEYHLFEIWKCLGPEVFGVLDVFGF
jgi:hypothetical protein